MIEFIGGFLAWHTLSFFFGAATWAVLSEHWEKRNWYRQQAAEAEREAKLAEGRANQSAAGATLVSTAVES